MSLLTLYLITVVPQVSHVLGTISIAGLLMLSLGALISGINYVAWSDSWSYEKERQALKELWCRPIKKVTIALLVMFFISALVPGTKSMAIIVGGHYATNNEEIAEMPETVAKLLKEHLEDITKKETENE